MFNLLKADFANLSFQHDLLMSFMMSPSVEKRNFDRSCVN